MIGLIAIVYVRADLSPGARSDVQAVADRPQLALHVANLVVIAFFLLPLVAVLIGSLQSEKTLHADTRRLLPPEVDARQFPA